MSIRAAFAPTLPLLAVALLIAGCHRAGADADAPANAAAAAFVPPRAVAAKPLPGQTPSTPITAYVGKFPHDPVDGVMFFDRTDVANALVETVPDATMRRHFRETRSTEKPIFARGGLIGAAGCDPDDCAGRDWTFFFNPADGTAEACYHDTVLMQDASRLFHRGSASMQTGPCTAS